MKAIIFAAVVLFASAAYAGGGVQFFVAPQPVFVHPQAVVVQRFHAQPFVQRQVVVQQQAAPQVNVQVRRGFFPRLFGPRVNVQVNR